MDGFDFDERLARDSDLLTVPGLGPLHLPKDGRWPRPIWGSGAKVPYDQHKIYDFLR